MKAVITGGAGFIGSHVSELFLANSWAVSILDDFSTGLECNVPSGATVVRGSVDDKRLLKSILPGCDAVIHLAASSSVHDSIEHPLPTHHTNLTATLVLLEATIRHRVPRFVFSSSAAVYGDTGDSSIAESYIPNPRSQYAVHKLACELYCGVYNHLHSLQTVCLRYFNVYGSRQRPDSPYTGVITKFVRNARSGQPMVIYGDGSQTRDFVSVKDVARANLAAATLDATMISGKVFNIGTGRSTTLNDLASLIRQRYPEAPKTLHAAPRCGEILYSQANISKARRLLHYEPKGCLRHDIALLD